MAPEVSTRDPDWQLYAAHRAAFTALVLAAAQTGDARLCVLGAGKCNDLDLSRLAQHYREIHLVDLEPAAVASAVSREAPGVRARLMPHVPVDLAVASVKRASKWRRQPPSPQELETAANVTLQGVLARLPGPFDVVVSACLLTQLGFALTQAIGERAPVLGSLRASTVRAHLQLLTELTAAHGTALFVSDLASSTHYPLDNLPAAADLNAVLRDVVAQRAFYQIARPELIASLLAELAPERRVSAISPWLWTGPQQRTYLVYGFEIAPNSRAA